MHSDKNVEILFLHGYAIWGINCGDFSGYIDAVNARLGCVILAVIFTRVPS